MKYRVLFLLLFAGCLSTNAAVRVTGMKVSGLVAPLGIDETPTFSWQTESDERGFQQQSYAITVTDASGKKVWHSGVVTSDAQSNIRYEGMPLRSRAAYRWTVRIAGTKGEVSKVATSTFETAFLDASEWKAEWIGGERSAAVPYYGTHFEVGKKKVVRARIYATALGVFTMKVNGAAVTENQLEPGESEFVKTVQYATYDVTPLLRHGRNTIVAQVGGGIFNVAKVGANGGLTERYCKEISNQGDVCLKAELYIEYADGTTETVLTDGTWLTHPLPTTGRRIGAYGRCCHLCRDRRGGEKGFQRAFLPCRNGSVRLWQPR